MQPTVVIAGSIAQKPWHGGHTWVFLQYVLGFRNLGWDVLFLDRFDPQTDLRRFERIMQGFDLVGAYSLLSEDGRSAVGVPREAVRRRTAESALLLNVMGFLKEPDILDCARKRVFLDIDPGFGQMWQEEGLCRIFSDHDHYVTIGENIGAPDCSIPTCGLQWIKTRQPVALEYWKPSDGRGPKGFTTIASWRGAYGPVPFRGRIYGLRVHEFRKYLAMPAVTNQRFEAALDIDPSDAADIAALERDGWLLVDPRVEAGDPWKYQAYVAASRAEFTVAKNMYVETRSGWFSDRSICYLASGKPVVVQDTGIRELYPTGKGLLAYSSLDEAASCVQEIARDYETHARAARDIASEYFDSKKVLCRLLENLGIQ